MRLIISIMNNFFIRKMNRIKPIGLLRLNFYLLAGAADVFEKVAVEILLKYHRGI
jgi:hypothetical protein